MFPPGRASVSCGSASPDFTVGNVSHQSCASGKFDTNAQDEVIGNASATPDHRPIADLSTAANAYVATENAATTDLAVVSNLAEVVNLGLSTDVCRAQFATIDAGVRTNLYIISKDGVPNVWDLYEC